MPARDTSPDSPLTFGDLLAALMVISEKAPARSLVSPLQNVSCSFGGSVRRSALITNAFHLKDTLECIELAYVISPPGPSDAKMSEMKFEFSFSGKAEGKLDVWLNPPKERRPEGSYKFGLGISAMQQGFSLHNHPCLLSFEKEKEALTCGNESVELKLGGENMMGGVLRVVISASYPHHGVLTVHLSASTYDEDPKAKATVQPADVGEEFQLDDGEEFQPVDDGEEFEERAMRRWKSRGYQREVLGNQTMETYLEH